MVANHGSQMIQDYTWYLSHALPCPALPKMFSLNSLVRRKHPDLEKIKQGSKRTVTSAELPAKWSDSPLIVCIPGIYEGEAYFRYLRRKLSEYELYNINTKQLRQMQPPVAELARIVISEIREIKQPIILLAHSKGGLVGRAVLAARLPNVYGLVAFATPWNGSQRAQIFPPHHPLRALLPGGQDLSTPWSEELNSQINERIIAISPHWDFHVPQGSTLSGAANLHLSQSGHFRPLYHRDGIAAVKTAILQLRAQIPDPKDDPF
ncbi:esterase/lipase family protein [Arcanobacterium hippocoleae]|uniref:esterase/lipase family protein n=1 Tax=Arcanobacterium hippocoleae TaxID=149017 RepID=UPI003341F1B2